MGTFSEHIQQSKNNLEFLSQINEKINLRWDWQVTAAYYVAVHLVNAHIVSKTNKNYLSHNQVADLINPFSQFSVSKFDEATYTSYVKLQFLSRRSRYLLNEGFTKRGIVDIQPACITYDKHFRKAIYHLDKIMDYISKNNTVVFEKCNLNCVELEGLTFLNFITK